LLGGLDHREPVAQHLHDGVEVLLCHCELPEHAPDILASPLVGEAEEGRAVMSTINQNTGTISRNQHDKHQPDQHRRRLDPTCQQSASNKASQRRTQHRVAHLPIMC
jgi:hypothetical protein